MLILFFGATYYEIASRLLFIAISDAFNLVWSETCAIVYKSTVDMSPGAELQRGSWVHKEYYILREVASKQWAVKGQCVGRWTVRPNKHTRLKKSYELTRAGNPSSLWMVGCKENAHPNCVFILIEGKWLSLASIEEANKVIFLVIIIPFYCKNNQNKQFAIKTFL